MKGLKERGRSTFLLILTIIILTALLFARDLLGVNFSKYVLVAVAVVSAMFMNHISLIYFIFFLFPVSIGLPSNFIFPLLSVILFLKKPAAFSRNATICFVIILVLELIHYPFYGFDIQLPDTIGYLTTIFFLCYLSVISDFEVQNRQCLLFFCLGLMVLFVAVWGITQIHGGGVEMLMVNSKRMGETKSFSETGDNNIMFSINSNGLAFFSLVGLAVLFVLYHHHKLRFVTFFLMSAVYVFIGALSLSRTWLMGVALLIVLFMIMIWNSHTEKKGLQVILLIAVVLIAGYEMFHNELIYQAFYNRMTESSMAGGNGRLEAMQIYNRALYDDPIFLLFGTGAVHYGNVLSEISISIHNGLQQILVSYGIIGLVFFLYITIKAFKRNYRKGFCVCAIPFIIALFFIQSGQLLNPHYNLYFFIVSFTALRLCDDERYISLRNRE